MACLPKFRENAPATPERCGGEMNRGLKAKHPLTELNQAAGLTRQIKEREQWRAEYFARVLRVVQEELETFN